MYCRRKFSGLRKGLYDVVVDMEGNMHLGLFHTFLAKGKSVMYAGMIYIDDAGKVTAMANHSGHYLPGSKYFNYFDKVLDELRVKASDYASYNIRTNKGADSWAAKYTKMMLDRWKDVK